MFRNKQREGDDNVSYTISDRIPSSLATSHGLSGGSYNPPSSGGGNDAPSSSSGGDTTSGGDD